MALDHVNDPDEAIGKPPRMLYVAFDVSPGNDLDRCDQVIEALDAAYTELRTAVIHQRSGVAASVVREFWRGNTGHAFKVTACIAALDPDDEWAKDI